GPRRTRPADPDGAGRHLAARRQALGQAHLPALGMSPRFGDERQQRDLDALHRIALSLPRSLSLRSVTDTLARELTLAIDRADECDISLWEPEHDRLVLLSVH